MAAAKKSSAKKAAKKSTAKKATAKKATAKKAAKKSTAKKATAKKSAKKTAKKATAGSTALEVPTSRIKAAGRDLDVRVSSEFVPAFNEAVSELLAQAAARAKGNGRATLRPTDL